MKSKRKSVPKELRQQIRWAEKIPEKDIAMMLLDGKSKTSCGCEVIGDEVCPHNNMGVLHLLMLQFTKEELEELKAKTEEEAE